MKLLMLTHAFERLDAVRVQLITDERNKQSQSAILKLGAKQEGTLRHNMVMPDGHRRNTPVYRILTNEWPDICNALQERLRKLEPEP